MYKNSALHKTYRILIMIILTGALLCSGVYFPVVNFSPAFLVLLMLLGVIVILSCFTTGKIIIPKYAKKYGGQVLAIILIMFFAYVINGEIINDNLILVIFSFFMGYACYESIDDKQHIRLFLLFYVTIISISCLVQLGQVAGIRFCFELWNQLQTGEKLGQFLSTRYLLGLATSPVDLGYQVSAALTIVLTYRFKRFNIIRYGLIVLYATSLWFTQTRSAILAVLTVLIVKFIVANRFDNTFRWISRIVVLVIVSVGIYFLADKLIAAFSISRFATAAETNGTLARWPMILTAFNHAFHHPFGMGTYVRDPNLVVGASGSVYAEVLNTAPHNLFANCVACYGFLGLIVLCGMYYQIWKTYQFAKTNVEDNGFKELYWTVFLCIIAIFVNALFHNKYLLNSDFSSHFFIGILFTCGKFSINRKTNY